MPIRKRFKIGDNLAQDDLTGNIHYASKMLIDYRGNFVERTKQLFRNPQDYVRPIPDYSRIQNLRPDTSPSTPAPTFNLFVGNTNILTNTTGAAYHLFDVGIGEAAIAETFVVR
jgi:hypothetical protein